MDFENHYAASPSAASAMGSPGPEEFVRAIVVRPYQATDENQLTLKVNEIIFVMEKDASGWWGGHKEGDTSTAWFPGVCVRELHEQGEQILDSMKKEDGSAQEAQATVKAGLDATTTCQSPTRVPTSDYGGRTRSQVASPQFSRDANASPQPQQQPSPQQPEQVVQPAQFEPVPEPQKQSAAKAENSQADRLLEELQNMKEQLQVRDAQEAKKQAKREAEDALRERRLQDLERQLEVERREKESARQEAKELQLQQQAAKEQRELELRLKAEATERTKLASEVENIKSQLEKERRSSQAALDEAKRMRELLMKEQQEKEHAITEKRKSVAEIESLKEELKQNRMEMSMHRSHRGSLPDVSDIEPRYSMTVDEPEARKNLFSQGGYQFAAQTPSKANHAAAHEEATAPRGSPLPPPMAGASPGWVITGASPPGVRYGGRSQAGVSHPSPARSESVGAMPLSRHRQGSATASAGRATSPQRAEPQQRRAESQGPCGSRGLLTDEAPPAGCVRNVVQVFEKRSSTPGRRSMEHVTTAVPASRFTQSVGTLPVATAAPATTNVAAPRRRRVSNEDGSYCDFTASTTSTLPVSVRPLDLQAIRGGHNAAPQYSSAHKDPAGSADEDLGMSPMFRNNADSSAATSSTQANARWGGNAAATWSAGGGGAPSFAASNNASSYNPLATSTGFSAPATATKTASYETPEEESDKPSVSVKDRVRSWQKTGIWGA